MSMLVAWIYLLLAILMEVAGTTCMKLADGFVYFLPSILIFIFYAISLVFLTLSLKRFGIGFAYAIWSAIGTILIFFIGVVYFHETFTAFKTLSLGLIVVGVAGLKQE